MVFGDRMIKTIIKSNSPGAFVRNHWLMFLIVLQPILDIVAFWTKNPNGTIAGSVRLIIMVVLPVIVFLLQKDWAQKLRFLASLSVVALVCALHLATTFAAGAVDLMYEISYTAKTAQMPILALSFIFSIKNDQTRNQAYWGLFFAAAIMSFSLGLSAITGTANVTYGEGLGISGWVIDDNRCANSTIVVVLAAFAIFCAVKSDKLWVNILVPAVAALVLGVNGTMTCYLSIFLINISFVLFLPIEKRIRNCQINKRAMLVLVVISILAACAYPLTPKYKISLSQNEEAVSVQGSFFDELEAKGYDISGMTNAEKLAVPEIRDAYINYYYDCLWYKSPNMFERFDIDEILLEYDMTTDGDTLIDTRRLKSAYASLMWEHSDSVTRMFGIDISDLWHNGKVDLENDWSAIFYYYGYFGFAVYVAFILYFVLRILRLLVKDFKRAFVLDNIVLLICFVLLIGLAQYSGAVLRRPNVSFYLSLILGLIHYQTIIRADKQPATWRGDWV